MKPATNTDPAKVPCKYCGTAILPATFERTGGLCMPCANNGTLSHGLFYSSSAPDRCWQPVQDNESKPVKVPCRFCGSLILPATAQRTGGFCMPHSNHAAVFLDTLGGKAEFDEPIPQKLAFQELLSKETRLALGVLFSIMQPEDELKMFSVKPQGENQLIAERGIAIFRNGQCITGFVAKWASNPGFDQDHEEVCEKDEIATAFGDEWHKIEKKIPEGSIFVRFRTSQRSWMSLCGRAGYAVKYNGEYLWHIVTVLN